MAQVLGHLVMAGVKSIVERIVRGKDPNTVSFNQIRELVEKELGPDSKEHDFTSKAWKKQLRELVTDAFLEEMERAMEAESEEEEEEEEEKKKRPAKKVKAGPSSDKEKKRSRPSSSASESSVPAAPEDPDLKALKDLASAMNLVPAIYKGFGDMSVEEKKQALRERLKEKGAKFKGVPTKEQIKQAREATQLKKDLEGIDLSNIIAGGSRRRAASSAPSLLKKRKKEEEEEEEDSDTASESDEDGEGSDDDDDDKEESGSSDEGGDDGSSGEEELELD